MATRSRIILTGSNLPKIRQPSEAAPSTINETTIADFTRVLDELGVQYRKPQLGWRALMKRSEKITFGEMRRMGVRF
jgi:hypothetical protein